MRSVLAALALSLLVAGCGGGGSHGTGGSAASGSNAHSFTSSQAQCAQTFQQIVTGVTDIHGPGAWVGLFTSQNKSGAPVVVGEDAYLGDRGNDGACHLIFRSFSTTADASFLPGHPSFQDPNSPPQMVVPPHPLPAPNVLIGYDGQLIPLGNG